MTVEGWGHTTYGLSPCADSVRDTYLLTGRAPRSTICDTILELFPERAPADEEIADEVLEAAAEDAVTDDDVEDADTTSDTPLGFGTPNSAAATVLGAAAEVAERTGDVERDERLRARLAIIGGDTRTP